MEKGNFKCFFTLELGHNANSVSVDLKPHLRVMSVAMRFPSPEA